MRKILALAFMVAASPALADGNGAATSDRTQGGKNPNCYMWTTNGGPLVYGVPIDALGKVFLTASQIVRSQAGLCTLTFQPATSYPECSSGDVISVNKIECQ